MAQIFRRPGRALAGAALVALGVAGCGTVDDAAFGELDASGWTAPDRSEDRSSRSTESTDLAEALEEARERRAEREEQAAERREQRQAAEEEQAATERGSSSTPAQDPTPEATPESGRSSGQRSGSTADRGTDRSTTERKSDRRTTSKSDQSKTTKPKTERKTSTTSRSSSRTTTQSATPSSPATAPSGPWTGKVGVADASALSAASGGTFAQDGATIKNRSISGDVLVTGDDVTIENVRISGEIIIRGSNGTTIKNSSVGALGISGSTNITVDRLEVFGAPGKDGLHVTSDSGRVRNVVIENSRIHSPKPNPSSHYDGIQVRGVDGLTLRNNSFELGPFKPQYNASIFLENANGGNANILIEGNYLDGGGYAVYLGGTNTTFRNNTFGPHANWGPLYPGSNMGSVTTSGNVDANGRPLTLR